MTALRTCSDPEGGLEPEASGVWKRVRERWAVVSAGKDPAPKSLQSRTLNKHTQPMPREAVHAHREERGSGRSGASLRRRAGWRSRAAAEGRSFYPRGCTLSASS